MNRETTDSNSLIQTQSDAGLSPAEVVTLKNNTISELCSFKPACYQPLAAAPDWLEVMYTPVLESTFLTLRNAHLFHLTAWGSQSQSHDCLPDWLTVKCLTKELSIPTSWPSPGLSWKRAGGPKAQVSWQTCLAPSVQPSKPFPLLSGRLGLLTCEYHVFFSCMYVKMKTCHWLF